MRLVVPLQGLVQGRGGLFLGSLIPCSLFYFFQLYLKRRRSPSLSNPDSRPSVRCRSIGSVGVSSRAIPVAKPTDSPYYIGLEMAKKDPYDRTRNPDGIMQLGLSESTLCFDLLERWMSENLMESMLPCGDDDDDDVDYGDLRIRKIAMYKPFDGLMELKVAMAGFLSRIMGAVSFDPENIAITAGANPAVEILTFCLADHGDALLIPTPYYPGFDRDIKFRTGVELIPVHCRSADNFTLTISALDQAFNQAGKRGTKVRGILFSNPSNPVGNIMSRELLCDILSFAQEKDIHVISDEIFAGSVYGDQEFVSMAEIADSEKFDKNRVHIIYSLSKDLSIPGFRAGIVYSHHPTVIAAAKKLTRFSSVPVPIQRLLISMLSDARFIEKYIIAHKQRIRDKHNQFVEALKQLGLPCAKSDGGLYCWVDMSSLLTSYSEKGELELFEKLLSVAKINATPGSACYCIEPGWFRCCFTALTDEEIPLVMDRIRRVAESSTS